MAVVSAKNLKKYYGEAPNLTRALDGVSLELERGECVAIVGSSGSGKTTLLNMLGALDRPDSGTVIIDGSDVTAMKEEERTVFRRRKIGFVFQNYNLVPLLSVMENITLPLELDGKTPEWEFINRLLDALGLAEKADAMPAALSGGQQQRTALARALATRPSLLLADEPTGNLDSKTSRDVMRLMLETGRQYHQTILLITHNSQIARMAERVLHLEDGRLVP
ncbi:MAG TPA: ABC transporter ATP-binding protein [Candidatus Fimivicinus intestinavium]|nr:ABC transporter ATP-binding protein [Candidatus Fimivicinus intestinavium]